MQIAKSKSVEDVGHMEKKMIEMGIKSSRIKHRERVMKSQLEVENTWLRRQL